MAYEEETEPVAERNERSGGGDGKEGRPCPCEETLASAAQRDSGVRGGSKVGLGSIYILETDDKALVKIGFTTRLTMRLETHRAFAKNKLGVGIRLLGFFPATMAIENALHRAFSPCRVGSEWYDRDAVFRQVADYGTAAARKASVARWGKKAKKGAKG
jgi:hypothetical protein